MNRGPLLLLLVSFGVFSYGTDAAEPVVCPVTEIIETDEGHGQCTRLGAVDLAKCQGYCKKFSPEATGECSMTSEHANCKPSCICKYPCSNGGDSGDPHYWSFDGIKFDYQVAGKKHYLIKPCAKYDTLPNFEIRQTNRAWSGPISVIASVELVVPEWERVVEVKVPTVAGGPFTFTVNGNQGQIPYRFPVNNFFSCDSKFLKANYLDEKRTKVVIETSFGVRITVGIHFLSIDIPKHPELQQKACGLLGTPNGNKADDCRLSTGETCTHQIGFDPKGQFNLKFGNSWIVPGAGAWEAFCFPPEDVEKHENIFNNIPPEDLKRIEQLCKDNIGNPAVNDCAKQLGIPPPDFEECVFDARFLQTAEEQREFIKTMLEGWAVVCKKQIPFVDNGNQGACCTKNMGMKNLSPVYRLVSTILDNHHYTVGVPEVISATTTHPGKYAIEGVQGFVATTPDDCKCAAGTVLKPVYRLFKQISATKADHFFTTCPIEAGKAIEKGYGKEGIAFYCVEKTAGLCGATLPLFRVLRGHDHFYTTNEAEYQNAIKAGATDEDMLCFIWPTPPAVTQ